MSGLSFANIESELSYAYLHAIAARASVACQVMGRHLDNVAVDAMLTGWGPFQGGGPLTEVQINVQLKATIKVPVDKGNTYSYSLSGIPAYNHLREKTKAIPRLLVVLFLPPNSTDWLLQNEDELALRRCAYWVSLYDAADTINDTSVTTHIPKKQVFNAEGLIDIMTRLSWYGAHIPYAGNF